MARIVARNLEHTVRWELSGAHVLLSVQAARLERRPGLLVMRRSSVRFRWAALSSVSKIAMLTWGFVFSG